MDDATARALLAEDDLVPVGITTITGADFYVTVPKTMPAPVVEQPEVSAPVLRTWGVDPVTTESTGDVDGIPSTRE